MPDTVDIISDNPALTLTQTTGGNLDGDQYSQIIFEGSDGNGSYNSLSSIIGSHSGVGTDNKGQLIFKVSNTTNDSLTEIMTLKTGEVTISGNLTVNGGVTSINSNEVNIGDSIIILNSDETGEPSQNGGIEIERGTSTNVSFVWDESITKWHAKDLAGTPLTLALKVASGTEVGDLTLANGSITDSSGAISFGSENLSTSGTLGCGAATVGGTLTLTGALDANSTADIADTLTCSKTTDTGLAVTSNATIGGTLTVIGLTNLNSNVTLGGVLNVTGATNLNGNVTLGDADTDNVTITGKIQGTTTFDNGATIVNTDTDTLTITEATTAFDGNVTTTANATVGGTLAVTGNTTLTGALDANSTGDFADTLTCSKTTDTGLVVTSNATVGGTLGCGAATVGGTLTLTGALDANSTADIADTLTCSKTTDTGLAVTSNATVGGTLAVTGVTTLTGALDSNSTGDFSDTLTCSKADGSGLVVTANATVGGTLEVTGNITGNVTGNVTGNCSGTALMVTQAAQTAITSVGTLTALQVDNININGNTLSSTDGTDLFITPLDGQQIVLDGTIIIDAGIVTGVTSITSTAFVGDVTGNCSGTALTVTQAAQTAITSVGTLTDLQVGNININGNTLSSTAGTDLLITPLEGQQIVLDGTIIIDAGIVTGASSIISTAFVGNVTGNCSGTALTVTQAAQTAITSVGTLTNLQVDNININGSTITGSTATDLVINVTDGQSVVVEGLNIDDGVVTGASSITSTEFVGDITGDVNGIIGGTTPAAGTFTTAKLEETANAIADTAGYGQLWVKTATPNELYFTNDSGNDIQITSGSSLAGGSLNELSDVTYSSGDLIISSLDTITTSDTAHDTAGTTLTIMAGNTTAGTTNNIAGGDLFLQGGQGKGSGVGGNIIFKTANVATSASTLNSLTEVLTVSYGGEVYSSKIDKTHTLVGTGFFSVSRDDGCETCNIFVNKFGGEIITTIQIDITGLFGGTDMESIIGTNSEVSNFYQIIKATNGIVYKVELSCVETPVSVASSQSTTIGIKMTDTPAINHGDTTGDLLINSDYQVLGTHNVTSSSLIDGLENAYLYLYAGDTGQLTMNPYTAGKLLVKLYGATF